MKARCHRTLTVAHASCSCEQGIQGEAMGMLGKAWSTGALMMVQVADTLPKAFHPRAKLEGAQSSLHRASDGCRGALRLLARQCILKRSSVRTPEVKARKAFSHVGHERVGEVVFIPVYDRSYPHSGVRAVMEVMLQKGAAETMAEVITYISSALNLLQVC